MKAPKGVRRGSLGLACITTGPLSIAVIEAFAARVPVVATRVGGVPEIVRHEDTGLLVPTEDAQALAQGITRLSHDADLRARLVANGERLYTEELTARSMVEHTLALYQRCLGSSASHTTP